MPALPQGRTQTRIMARSSIFSDQEWFRDVAGTKLVVITINLVRQERVGTRSKRETSVTSSRLGWVTVRRIAGAVTRSLPKRRALGRSSSSNHSSLGDSAVAANAAHQVQARPSR